jgi:hypothetical protein
MFDAIEYRAVAAVAPQRSGGRVVRMHYGAQVLNEVLNAMASPRLLKQGQMMKTCMQVHDRLICCGSAAGPCHKVVASVTGHDQWCSWIKLPTSDGIGKNSLAMLPDTA